MQRPLQIVGWSGASDNREASKDRLRAGPSSAPPGSPGRDARTIEGPTWFCAGPGMAQSGSLVAVIRGRPLWRTDDQRITRTPSDAHAILEAYRLHGPSFLERLHGSFAVVILDPGSQLSLLAVDRMGIERLTYHRTGSELTFATSAEIVARASGTHPRIRLQSLLSYLFFRMVPSPDTVFENVRKVPPATAVILRNGVLSEHVYWKPDFTEPPARGASFEVLKESLHKALAAGVTAAEPTERTGAFLSGGLDSSTVAGFLGKVTSRRARTFSIGFGFDDYDELRFARVANARFHCDAHEYQIRPEDIVQNFTAIAAEYDEPFGNESALPTLCCARLAASHGVDHLLAGDGGDELFAGNKRYAEQLVFEYYQRVPRILRTALLEPVLNSIPPALRRGVLRRGRNYVAQANTPLPDRLESWNILHRLGFETVLHPEFRAAVDLAAPLVHMRSVYSSSPSRSVVNRMLHYDWRFTLADNDLRKVGTMCDRAGVRVSYPMLHPDVVDLSVRVPPALKMHGMELRSFYKRAMADFLPAEIIAKRKHGFGLPFGLWLQRSQQLAEVIQDSLAGLRSRRIIRPEFLDRLNRLHGEDDPGYFGVMIWALAMLEQWFQQHALTPD